MHEPRVSMFLPPNQRRTMTRLLPILLLLLAGCDSTDPGSQAEPTILRASVTSEMVATFLPQGVGNDGLAGLAAHLSLTGDMTVTDGVIAGTGTCSYSTTRILWDSVTMEVTEENGAPTTQSLTITGLFALNGNALIEIQGCDDIGSPSQYKSIDFSPELPGPYLFEATGFESDWAKRTDRPTGFNFSYGTETNFIRLVKS
jgi:hypothetical protein